MAFMQLIQPWQLLLVALAGWINRHQQDVIAYIQEENRILKGKLKGRRIRLTDDERRRLAVKGKAPGTEGPSRGGLHRDAGHHPGLAPKAYRAEMGLVPHVYSMHLVDKGLTI